MMNSGWKGIMLEFGSRWRRWLVSNLPCSVPVSSWSHWNTGSLFCFSGTEQRKHFPLCDTGPVRWELSLSSVRLQPLRRELQVFDMCCAAQQANKPSERGADTHVGTALSIWARDIRKPGPVYKFMHKLELASLSVSHRFVLRPRCHTESLFKLCLTNKHGVAHCIISCPNLLLNFIQHSQHYDFSHGWIYTHIWHLRNVTLSCLHVSQHQALLFWSFFQVYNC